MASPRFSHFTPTRPVGGLLAFFFLAVPLPGLQAQTLFTVNTTDDLDDGTCDETHCSLREALAQAGLVAEGAIVAFNIPGTGPHSIQPTSPLPSLLGATILDGTTEPDFAGSPVIELDGTHAGAPTNGLDLVGSGNTVRGLVINRFSGNGISIGADTHDNRVEGCFIGTDVDGTSPMANSNAGVMIGQSHDNVVGGTTGPARNVISGNPEGITIVDVTATGNLIRGNYIGTNATGDAAIPNTTGIVLLAPGNTVGGTEEGAGNLISGNQMNGVNLQGENATGNTVQGNLIGTDASGAVALSNGECGVAVIASANDNLIGGSEAGARNVLSGNTFGILISDISVTGTVIQGNYIGTDALGSGAIPNTQTGILLWGLGTLIGGPEDGAGNIISGNAFAGIDLGPESAETVIQGNYIGTDAAGSTALGNDLGIFVNFSGANSIGGIDSGAGNVISGNTGSNLTINGLDAAGNTIQGNFIGTDATGMAALENGRAMSILDAPDNIIGGTTSGAGNVISGNYPGISVEGSGATGNVFQGNYIGVDASGSGALGNRGAGIRFTNGASGNIVGGTEAGAGNIIANSSWVGISVFPDGGTGNRILGNAIFDNGGMGIELNRDGVSPNDEGDVDTGPNELQNYPEIESVVGNGGGLAQASLNSAPSATYTLDFFADVACDDSGHGEGRTPLGTASLTTDASGHGSVTRSFSGITGTLVTATATDALGNTSEFSQCAEVATLGITPSPATKSVLQGQTATYTISVAAQGGTFEGEVDLSCAGNPAGTSCTFDQNQLALAGGQASATMSVTTVAPARSAPVARRMMPGVPWELLALAGLSLAVLLIAWPGNSLPAARHALSIRRFRRILARAGLLIALPFLPASCGDDGSRPPSGGTPPGSYTLTVTATWQSATVTTQVTMMVQEGS